MQRYLRRQHVVALALTAVVLENNGALAESAALTRESLRLCVELKGEDHPDVTKTLYNLAMVVKAGGDYDQALELFDEVLERNLATVGRKNARPVSVSST